MNKFKTYYFVLLLALFGISFSVVAQNNTSSPYSIFGLGDMGNQTFGRNLGLGGAGYGVRDSRFINLKNPASLGAIDSLSVLFETGVFIKYTQSSNLDHNASFKDGNITHVTMAHRYNRWLAACVGAMPFSNIGYNLQTSDVIIGENRTLYTMWNGSGGLNKMFYSLAYTFKKNYSLGLEASYIYGPINQTRDTYLFSGSSTRYYLNSRYRGVSLKYAGQFQLDLDESGTSLTVGGIYTPGIKLTGETDVQISQNYGGVGDSVYSGTLKTDPIWMPTQLGVGLSFTYKGKYLFAADFEQNDWTSQNRSSNYINQSIFSVGFEKLQQSSSLKFSDRCAYRIGFKYDSGYVKVRGQSINDMRLSLAYGMPIMKSRSMLNFTLEAGQRGTVNSGLIRERYAQFTVGIAMHEYWFTKRKFD